MQAAQDSSPQFFVQGVARALVPRPSIALSSPVGPPPSNRPGVRRMSDKIPSPALTQTPESPPAFSSWIARRGEQHLSQMAIRFVGSLISAAMRHQNDFLDRIRRPRLRANGRPRRATKCSLLRRLDHIRPCSLHFWANALEARYLGNLGKCRFWVGRKPVRPRETSFVQSVGVTDAGNA